MENRNIIDSQRIKEIEKIWDSYLESDKIILDIKGNELPNIDENRKKAIIQLRKFMRQFMSEQTDIYEFKITIDSFNKRNNLWGFTAAKGQMFFNQLVKTNEESIGDISRLLRRVISKPNNLKDALEKIEKLEEICMIKYNKAEDRRKVPNPGSVGYYLSYFWQIYDYEQWAIMYTSLINAFKELEIWKNYPTQKETYNYFFLLNEQIKDVLRNYTNKEVTNWDVEHAFWNFKGNTTKIVKGKKKTTTTTSDSEKLTLPTTSSFVLSDYLIPRVSKLVELGNETKKSAASKGSEFEKLVTEIFKQLDFEVQSLGQGSGRNPDAIIKFREQNTAFIVDAKAYSNGYSLGIDDRAIKEYINCHCPILQKEGYKRIGFIIVSNSFKSTFDSFINDITWNTDIKRFILLTSEALLYLLAYKTKDRLSLSNMIESIISFGNPVTSKEIIEEFDDF